MEAGFMVKTAIVEENCSAATTTNSSLGCNLKYFSWQNILTLHLSALKLVLR